MQKVLFITVVFFFLFSCSKEDSEPLAQNTQSKTDTLIIPEGLNQPTIQNGYYGYVIEWKGDFMPGTSPPTGTIDSIQKEIYVYNKLTFDSIIHTRTDPSSWFWTVSKFSQTPIAIIKANSSGFYQIELGNGDYSGFVKIDDHVFYSNRGTSDGQLGEMNMMNLGKKEKNFDIDFEKTQ